MNDYDQTVLGVENPLHPANQSEVKEEITYEESLLNQIDTLEEILKNRERALKFRISQLDEIKTLCEGMTDENGLARLILNRLR